MNVTPSASSVGTCGGMLRWLPHKVVRQMVHSSQRSGNRVDSIRRSVESRDDTMKNHVQRPTTRGCDHQLQKTNPSRNRSERRIEDEPILNGICLRAFVISFFSVPCSCFASIQISFNWFCFQNMFLLKWIKNPETALDFRNQTFL